jgi:hypothetical protein
MATATIGYRWLQADEVVLLVLGRVSAGCAQSRLGDLLR